MGVLVNGGLMFSLGHDNWIRLFVWLVIGLVIYVAYSRHHSVLTLRRSGLDQATNPSAPVAQAMQAD
jgi:APA family basic amino acid/polyamine antiporter